VPRQLVARRPLAGVGPVDEDRPAVGGRARVRRLHVAVQEARRGPAQGGRQRRRIAAQVVDQGDQRGRGPLAEAAPALVGDAWDPFRPPQPPLALEGGVPEPGPPGRVRQQAGPGHGVVVPPPGGGVEPGQVVDEHGVLVGRDRVVAGGEQVAGHVPHEQGRPPAVAPVAEGCPDDGVVDELRCRVEQPRFPRSDRPAADVARHPHGEVVIEVDVLHDMWRAADPHPLEPRVRPAVRVDERLPAFGGREQLVDRGGEAVHVSQHRSRRPSRPEARHPTGPRRRTGRRRCGRRRRSAGRGSGGRRGARPARPTPGGR